MKYSNNGRTIVDSDEFKIFVEEFDSNIHFLENFSELIFLNGRITSFFSDDKMHLINTSLMDSSVQTLKNIKMCCSIGSFSDANTLVRKLRDDLMLYVYVLAVVNKRKLFIYEDEKELKIENQDEFVNSFLKLQLNTNLNEDEKAISAWLSNKVLEQPKNIKMKLSFENYMKFLKQEESIIKILRDYKLQNYWESLRNKLNNYVHNNGIQFTYHNLIREHSQDLTIHFKNVNTRTSYIVTFFLVLIIMTDSTLISSTDMIDYQNIDINPPEGCQYEIAPFIQNYIDNKVVRIHPELKEFLKENNYSGMKII